MFSPVFSAEKTFVREYTYYAEDYDSKITARTNALIRVKEELLEETSTLIVSDINLSSWEKVIDGKFSSGEDFQKNITTISAGITTTTILDEKWTGETFWIKAEIVVDPEDIERKLNIIFNNRKLLSDIMNLENIVSQADTEIGRLKILLKDEKEKLEVERLSKAYLLESDILRSTDLIYKGLLFFIEGKLIQARLSLEEAIELGQNMSLLYGLIANTYIADQSVSLDRHDLLPDAYGSVNKADVYRGIKYLKLALKVGEHEEFIYGDLAQAYFLLEKNWKARYYRWKAVKHSTDSSSIAINYNNSALPYLMKGKNRAAKKLLLNAVRYDSTLSSAYTNLAHIAFAQKEYNKSLKLYKQGIYLSVFSYERNIAYVGVVTYYISLSYEAMVSGDFQVGADYLYKTFEFDTTFASRDSLFSIVYLNLAIASMQLGKHEEALYQCLESIALPNNFIKAQQYGVLGDIYGITRNENKKIENYIISARLGFKPVQEYLDANQIVWKE